MSHLNDSKSHNSIIMTRQDEEELEATANHCKQTRQQQRQSNTKLYKYRRMKILLAIAAGFCLTQQFHSSNSIRAQETTTGRPIVADTTSVVPMKQEQQSTSQQSITVTIMSTTEAPVNLDNKMTTITIFKIQKQALHNSSSGSSSSSSSDEQSWLIDKSNPTAPAAGRTVDEPSRHSSPSPLASATVASSKLPPVLRPSIEEVASKLSRKHLNLEHDNWRLRQSSSSVPQSLFDDTTKLADGSAGLSPIEAEQDVVQVSSASSQLAHNLSADNNQRQQQQQQPPPPERASVFSTSPTPKLSEGHHREHYLHIDASIPASVSASASATADEPRSKLTTGRRKKGGFFTGEAYEISQCHQYLRIYNAPSTGANPGAPAGLYQMISNQQLPCSCEMRSLAFVTDLAATTSDQQQSVQVAPASWLSCDHVQLIGGYLHPRGSNSSADTWDMGKASGINSTDGGGGGPIQVTRFSQRNSGLQTLHAQKFLNLQLSNLRSIDLSDNRIRQIKMDAFHGLELSLENLNLANNLLGDSRAISYGAQNSNTHQEQKSKLIFFTDEFNRLKKLKWLSLRNNRINQISSTIFTKHSSVVSFIQQDSTNMGNANAPKLKISDSGDEQTTTGEQLVYLDLSDNILKTVPSDAIIMLNKLQTLNLRGNKIVQLDQQSKFPKSLKYLDLSGNLIKIIRSCDLIDLPDLIELNLSHNQLSHLDKTAFLSSSSLATIATIATNSNNNLQTANVESSLSSPTNNLIVPNAVAQSSADSGKGLQLLVSGNNDEQSKLFAGVNEQTKSFLSNQDQEKRKYEGIDSLVSLSHSDVGHSLASEQQPKRRTRRDVIGQDKDSNDNDVESRSSAIMDDLQDDLEAEESSLSAAAAIQHTGQQQTLTDDLISRRQREFNSTIKLNLAYNYFTSLPGDSLLKFANLQQLDLSYNRIRNLDSNYLCSIYNLVESLRKIDLSGNLLTLPQTNNSAAATSSSATKPTTNTSTAADKGAPAPATSSSRQLNRLFGCLQKLERLSLATNRLSSQVKSRSKQGKTLDNDESGLSSDDEDEFTGGRTSSSDSPDRLNIKFGDNYGSRYLNELDLSDNQLRTMPLIEQVFQQPITLMLDTKKTNSSSSAAATIANELQQYQLNQWMASRVYLVSLNLSYNYIDRLEERDFDHLFSLRHLSFDFNRLSSLPIKLMRKFTSLDRASFDGNRLGSLEPLNELFERSIRTLRYLNLANNRLTNWPAINKIIYDNPLRQEYMQNSASHIHIDSEDKQASALQFALEELNLEGNLLTSSNVSTLFDQFAYMKSLRILNLSQNLLNRVRSEWFKFANQNLKTLSLAGNKINSIDLGSFAYNQLNELQQLSLQHNLLKELKRKTFDSLPELTLLDLSHNFIHTINSETFHQMNAMQVLNLSNNKLATWKCEYFSNLCNSISGNINADLNALLSVVQPPIHDPAGAGDRQPVSSIIDLDLSHNSLSQLRANSISVHTRLERLNLAHNKLSYIPHDLFKATILDSKTGRQMQLVSSLKQLNLAHNRLQTVDNINLRPLRNLISFDLSQNELQTLGLDVILMVDNNGNGNQRGRNIIVSNNATNQLIDTGSNNPAGSDAETMRPQQTAGQQRQSRMMQQQQQQQVSGNGLPALGKLRHLNLSNNQLTQVNQSLLHELSPFVLLNLDLSHNYLESESLPYGFYAKIFGPTKQQADSSKANDNYDLVFTLKLESLNLSHNRLSEFPAQLLDNHHVSMESCNLAHNRIQTLAPNSNILIQIKSLNLEFNPLNRESNELILFEHKSARHLNLAATRLYAIKEVTQSVAQATMHQNAADKTLAQQFAAKHRLVANQTSQLDLIRSISKPIDAPYVQQLNLSSNQLVWLAANIFERMHSLETLDLSNNQLTRLHLLTNQLSPLSASLESLNLASNLFTSIDLTDFSQLTRLKRLDLSSLLSLQKLNCRFLSKLTTLKSLRLYNFPQVRQNLNNILANLQQQQLQQRQAGSHAPSSERMVRKLQQELLMSTIGPHCFRDEPLVDEPNQQQQQHQEFLKWFNLQELELELFGALVDEDNEYSAFVGAGKSGFQLGNQLIQLLGPETTKLTLFGSNLTSLADDSLSGITGRQLDLRISYTSLARMPLEQVQNGISKRTKLNLDFRNNNIHSLDVKSLQILDELQLNNQILQKGDHSSLRLASNPMRCDCQTRPLWLWLNQRWANFELAPNQQPISGHLDEQAGSSSGEGSYSSGGNSANYWLKFSSVSQTSDIKCNYPAKLRGKLAQYVNYHDLVCKGSSSSSSSSSSIAYSSSGNSANQAAVGRQSRKRNDTKAGLDYSKDGDLEDDSSGGETSAADYWDSADSSTDETTATPVRVTKFNKFPSLMFNQTIYYLQNIPVPFISDSQQINYQQQQQQQHPGRVETDSFEYDSSSGDSGSGRMGKRDGNSVNQPIYPILNDRQIVNTRYNKHRPNTQQRHSSFDTLSTLKQFQPAHHHSGQKQTLLTDSDVYILTIMSIAMSIMSFVIITICLLKYKMDRSDKERILTDHGKMLMSQALFSINNGNFNHQSFEPKHSTSSGSGSSSNNSSSKKSSNRSGSSGCSSENRTKNNHDAAAIKPRTTNTSQATAQMTIPPLIGAHGKSRSTADQVLVPMQLSPSSMAMPAAAQNFLMRSPTVRRMQGLATNASDWFKYTLRAYPSNAAMHRGQRRRRLFLGDTVPVVSQLTTGKRGFEQQLAANEPGSPATLAVGCPQHAFKAIDRLRERHRANCGTSEQQQQRPNGPIEEECLHCARLLATIQQTKVQYLIGTNKLDSERAKQQKKQTDHKDDNEECFVPPSLIRALAQQLDQANAESNYVSLGPEWFQQQQQQPPQESLREQARTHHKQRVFRSMRTFGMMDRRVDEDQQQQQQRQTASTSQQQPVADGNGMSGDSKPRKGSQIPSIDVIGRFTYQSDSQVDTPTPYDARCSSMLGGSSSQMDGSEDTNGHYNRDGVFILASGGDTSDDDEDREPVSVLLNKQLGAAAAGATTTTTKHHPTGTMVCDVIDDADSRLTDQQEESIRMQDECSRSSSPIAYGFMRNSGPSSLASSGTARNAPQPDHQQLNPYQPDHSRHQHAQPSSAANTNNNRGHYILISSHNNNNNNNSIVDNYSVVRKKRGDNYHTDVGTSTNSTTNHDDQQQQQVIISRL